MPDWTAVPGWDSVGKKYVELDCESWIKENKIRETGERNGKKEFPKSDATQPDEMHEKIRAWVNQRGKVCYEEVNKHIVGLKHALELENKAGQAPVQDKVENIKNEGIIELTDQMNEDRSSMVQKRQETEEAWAALGAFKKQANLNRVAEYGDRRNCFSG